MGDDAEGSRDPASVTDAEPTTTDAVTTDAVDVRLAAGAPLERHAVRALLITPDAALLLLKIAAPDPVGEIWVAPGGGLEPGEAPDSALRRELREETGLEGFTTGPEVWRRSVTFRVGERRITQHEGYWLVRTERFAPRTDQMPVGPERDWFRRARWWTASEIRASRDRFAPRRLGVLLAALVEDGPPDTPLDVGV